VCNVRLFVGDSSDDLIPPIVRQWQQRSGTIAAVPGDEHRRTISFYVSTATGSVHERHRLQQRPLNAL